MNKNTFKLNQIELKDKKVFRDAIHNYIPVNYSTILELINTPQMQRLRRIKQLGGTFQVYQSAEHSRFTHSLGVYYIILRMIDETPIKDHLSDYEKLVVMCAGLLHDLGHGPFSHSFEEVFNTNHEFYTSAIINDNTDITQVLEKTIKGLAKDVSMVIEKTYPNKILVQMVSSQLDADRMDYLLRDSYFTGTTYGQFDLSRIIRVIKIDDNKIVYKASGVQAIENYILARYHMYWQVYFHPTVRSYDQLLKACFDRIKDLYNEGFDLGDIRYLKPFLDNKITTLDYLNLDEGIITYYFKVFSTSNDKILCDLTSRYLNRVLFDYEDYTSKKRMTEIIQDCNNKGYDAKYYVRTDDQTQIPYLHYGERKDIGEIEILTNNGLVSLPEASEIVGAITSSNNKKIDHKIYFPK
ncbi:MAG: HD domain-containing protein [Thomasclavelia sp.]|nr:HD domain-containing protein [Thomasclavelia sp.]